MPTMDFPTFRPNQSPQEFADNLARLNRNLQYIMGHLDHQNVRQLFTEYCNIQSEDGETVIDGPLVVMRSAASTTIRLQMGYDSGSSDFVFQLFNQAGNLAIQLDSTGNITMTGGTLRTDSTGQRIELNSTGLFAYDTGGNVRMELSRNTVDQDDAGILFYQGSAFQGGLRHVIGNAPATDLPDDFLGLGAEGIPLSLYSFGDDVYVSSIGISGSVNIQAGFTIDLSAPGISLSGGALGVLVPSKIEFSTNIGFFGSTAVAKDSVANLSTAATLGGTIDKLNELINALQGYGLV